MRAPLRIICADFQSVPIAVEPQAGHVRDPQQRARHAAPTLEFARIPHIPRNFDRFLPHRGEDVGSGRLAPRALRAALPDLPAAPRAAPERQPHRQDPAR